MLKQADLAGFIGTEKYHRLTLFKRVVFTDGMAYLAEHGECFWLMTDIAAHCMTILDHCNQAAEIGMDPVPDPSFLCITLKVANQKGVLTITDGNDHTFATQEIDYTDFPLDQIKCYAQYDSENTLLC